MKALLRMPTLLLLSSIALAGCAGSDFLGGGSQQTTASIAPKPQVDPACVALGAQIESLRQDGVEEKLEKAAARKYKLKRADITKANDLTKANSEFRSRCSTLQQASAVPTGAVAAAPKVAASRATAAAKAKANPAQ